MVNVYPMKIPHGGVAADYIWFRSSLQKTKTFGTP